MSATESVRISERCAGGEILFADHIRSGLLANGLCPGMVMMYEIYRWIWQQKKAKTFWSLKRAAA
ncbi:hypothetical protein [Methanogenium cariaci]